MLPVHDPYYYDDDSTICPVCHEKLDDAGFGRLYCDHCDWSSEEEE